MQISIKFIPLDPKRIVEELEKLNSFTKLNLEEIREQKKLFKYPYIQHYLESLIHAAKPETTSAELLRHLADDIFKEEGFSEVKLSVGFGDFIIQENKVNPILLELKPAFIRTEDKNGDPTGIKVNKLEFADHKNQVQKYLTANDYIILSDLRDACLFSRDALVNFKPFYHISFTELLRMYLDHDCLWDIVRILEDQHVKPELEDVFFQDLNKWFGEFKSVRFNEKSHLSHNELVVLLINKIIFIKTLEDYGLIPYKFLDDEYFSKVKKWEFKSKYKVFENFFGELEDWFFEYYDTELFRVRIWDYLEKDEENLEKFREVFETVLGLGKWEYTFGKGLIHYNYRKIDEDVFGKAYETFIAKQRKDSGIFYTHRLITQYMSEKIVQHLFEPVVNEILACFEIHDYKKAFEKMNEMYRITIADTASGSGSFLIKVFREIYKYYQIIYSKLEYTNKIHGMFEVPAYVTEAQEFIKKALLDNKRRLISGIILRHIHGIDIDERALETAKTNLWKEAVKVEKSLFKYSSLGKNNNHILPNLGFNFHQADSLYDLPLQVQIDEISKYHKNEIIGLHKLRKQYLDDPTHPEVVDKSWDLEYPVRTNLEKSDESIKNPSLLCLKFFYVFFDESGNPLPEEQQGFSGIISNPPWEEIYPVKKEFADIGKYQMDKSDFDIEFEKKLLTDVSFKKEWGKYSDFYKKYTEYINENYSYHKLRPSTSTAMRSHLNYFKLFFEKDFELLQKNGYLNILIPSSFQTDEGCYGLRKLSIEENKLIEMFSFENRGFFEKETDKNKKKLFPDVDNRFKFTVTLCQKKSSVENYSFKAKFYLHHPKEVYESEKPSLEYSLEKVKKFSPENLSIMEFSSETDNEICSKILSNHNIFGNLGYVLRREFNVTDDNELFTKEKQNVSYLPVYEGKNIQQFNSFYSKISYFVNSDIAYEELINKEVKRIKTNLGLEIKSTEILQLFKKNKLLLDYQTYRMVYRSVASSTNERTLIATILPKNFVTVNSLNYLINCSYEQEGDSFIQKLIQPSQIVFITSLLNSVTLNYYLRNKISANLNMFYIYELPIPEVSDSLKKDVVFKAFQLLYHKSDGELFNELGKELGIKPQKNIDEIRIRAELEVIIAKELFGLTIEEWNYLTSTFIYGDASDSKKEMDSIIEESKKIFG